MTSDNETYREGLDELSQHYYRVLQLLGEDPTREGLQKTCGQGHASAYPRLFDGCP